MSLENEIVGANEMAKKEIMWTPGDSYLLRGDEVAVIYAIDAPGNFPIHGRVKGINGDNPTSWTWDGRWSGSSLEKDSHPLDLTIIHKVD